MPRQRFLTLITVVLLISAVPGCSRAPQAVTITDKDSTAPYLPPSRDAQRPTKQFGLSALENSRYAIEMKAEYDVVSQLVNAQGSAESIDHHLIQARDDLFANIYPFVEKQSAHLVDQYAPLAASLDSVMYRTNPGKFTSSLQQSSVLVDQIAHASMSERVRSSNAAQAVIAYHLLDEVDTAYSNAFNDSGKKIISDVDYEDAVAYFVQAKLLIESIALNGAPDINKRLASLKTDVFPNIDVPGQPINSDEVSERLAYIKDQILRATNVAIDDVE